MNASNKEILVKILFNTESWLLALILLVAAILRFYGLDYSYSNDELSALSRLDFVSLSALIEKGIMVDFHPALVQFFLYYWTELFGITEHAVRFPFVIFGIGSVWLAYRVAKEWFGSNTALLTASAMAGLQFFIMYSQLARPYSPGLFFTWAMVLYWTRILKGSKSYAHALLGGIAMTLAMYTHYFSFMQVMIVGGLGLILIKKQDIKYYLIAGTTALLLWLPHIWVTIHHLGKGGVGSWLGPPESDFLWQFLLFVFNDSIGMLTIFVLIALVGVAFNLPRVVFNRWQAVCLIMFVVPFSIGFYYSLYVNPVLQYSTLLFAAPSTLMLFFSFYGHATPQRLTTIIVVLILAGTTYSTVVINRHYSTEGFGVFKELASKIKEWDDTFGKDNILKIANVNSPKYLYHYLERIEHPVEFDLHNVQSDSSRAELCKLMANHPGEHLSFAWSTRYVPLETYEWIRKEFPYLQEAEYHFNSGVYLFSRLEKDERIPTYDFDAMSDPHSPFIRGMDENKLNHDSTGWYTVMLPADEFTWNYSVSVKTLDIAGGELVVASAKVVCNPDEELTLVFEYKPKNGEKDWYGQNLSSGCVDHKSKSHEIILARQFPENISPEDELIVYLWKRSKSPVEIRNLNISIYQSVVSERSTTPK